MTDRLERSKAQAIFFLLGAVLVGGALGFTANRAFEQRGPHQRSTWSVAASAGSGRASPPSSAASA